MDLIQRSNGLYMYILLKPLWNVMLYQACIALNLANLSKISPQITLYRTRYVGKCSSVGHDVRFERVVMVRGVYFYDIDVGRQDFS